MLLTPLKEEVSQDSFQIKTDSTTSCDEDSETKFSAGKHEVIIKSKSIVALLQ